MRFSDMPYRRVTFEELEADYAVLMKGLAEVSCEEDCLAVLMRSYRIGEKMTPMDLCYVRHGMDVNDPFYAAEQQYYDEIGPRLGELGNRFRQGIVESEFSDTFRRLMGSLAFDLTKAGLSGFDSRVIPLAQEENAILSRYNQLVSNAKVAYNGREVTRSSLAPDLQSPDRDTRRRAYQAIAASWEGQRAELEEIFDKLVKNRDAQANIMGYPSFVELSYVRMNRIGYGPEDVGSFREQVKELLVPLAALLNDRRRKRLGLDRLYPWDGISFQEGNPVPLGDEAFCLEKTREMFRAISPETGEYMDYLLSNGLCDVTAREGKQSGGYCTIFEATRDPFIFANFDGTSENAYIMSHEGGHGFYYYRKRGEDIRDRATYTSEMAETHAMAMEFFCNPHMELIFGDRAEDYRRMHLETAVTRVIYQCQQDEFQEILYRNPQLTPAERNQVWAKLERDYFPFREYPGEEEARVGCRWQRIPHVFLWPFYAIDYGLAQVCALQYGRRMQQDPEGAWKSYLAFCDASGSHNFPESIRAAGLDSPFDEQGLQGLVAWLRTQL